MKLSENLLCRRFLVVFAVIWGAAVPDLALAQEDPLRVVCIASRQKQEVSERLAEALESQLGDLDADLRLEWVDELDADPMAQIQVAKSLASSDEIDLVIWVKNLDTESALLYIADTASENTMLRVLYFEGTDREIRYESIAYVVRSVARAVSRGGGIGILDRAPSDEPREEAPEEPADEASPEEEPAAEQATPEPREEPGPTEAEEEVAQPLEDANGQSGRSIELSVTYMLLMHSPQVPTVHAVRTGVVLGMADWARPYLAYRAVFPFEVSSESGSAAVTHHPLELGWSSMFRRGKGRLGAGVGFSADKVTWLVESLGDGISAASGDSRWIYAVSPFLCASWTPGKLSRLYLGVGADVVLNKWDFVVETPGGTETLDSPRRVEGYVQAGFEFVFY